jgi:hypothetical protein
MKASWKAPTSLLIGGLLALWAACGHAPPPPPPPPPPPGPAASAPVIIATTPASPPPAEALAPLLARGPLHHAPIELPGGKGARRWLVLLGDAVVESAWLLEPGGAAPRTAIEGFPQAVRVTGQRTQGGVVYLEITTVAAGDLPGGLRAIVPLDATGGQILTQEWASLAGVESLAGLDKYLAGARSNADYTFPAEGEPVLSDLLPAGGAEVFESWPSLGWRRAGRLGLQEAADAPLLARAQALLRAPQLRCVSSVCSARDADHALLGLAQLDMEGNRLVVRRLLLAPTPHAAAPRRVAARKEGRLAAALGPLVAEVAQVRGEAPFAEAGGSVGLASVRLHEADARGEVLAVSEGPLTRIFSLDGAFLEGFAIEVGFADIDGDGFTDVVVRTPGKQGRTPQVYLVPPASRSIESIQPDVASAWAIREASSIEDAIRRALQVPARGLTSAEACAAIQRGPLTADQLFEYTEPNLLDLGRTSRRLPALRRRDLQAPGAFCAEPLVCSPSRPFCQDRQERDPGLTYFWFDWPRGQLRLVALADYGGS